MNDIPKISVICPVYNSAQFITRTLEGIFSQNMKPYELILSDDGSTDSSLRVISEVLGEYSNIPVTVLKNPHRGPGAARNAGINNAKGEWIAFIDSDDIWKSNKLEKVSEIILQNKQVNFICHAEEHLFLNGSIEILDYGAWYDPNKSLTLQLYNKNLFSTSAIICKRKLLMDVGLFDEKLMSAQDYELWLRLSSHIQPYFIREVLGTYLDRQGNISSKNALRRWKNMVIIALRYRHQVNMPAFLHKILRTSASMLLQSIR